MGRLEPFERILLQTVPDGVVYRRVYRRRRAGKLRRVLMQDGAHGVRRRIAWIRRQAPTTGHRTSGFYHNKSGREAPDPICSPPTLACRALARPRGTRLRATRARSSQRELCQSRDCSTPADRFEERTGHEPGARTRALHAARKACKSTLRSQRTRKRLRRRPRIRARGASAGP